MPQSPIEQVKGAIQKANNIVVTLPRTPSVDAITSSLGLAMILRKMNKKVKIVCSNYQVSPAHQFLPKSKEIHSELTALRKFIINLDVSRTKVEELSYDIGDDKLSIFVSPKNGFFEAKDVSTSATSFEYDLIIIVDTQDLESLGGIYENNTEFFYHTPIINIDHNPANEHFGQINMVDLVATSTSEIVFELIKELKGEAMDEYIATNLLAGIISKTRSFQSKTVTPKSLAIASYLIENGARRDEIIKHLYQTKSLATLKLWGRVLARLRTDLAGQIVWSLLNKQDFERAGAQEKDLEGVIDELIVNTTGAEVIILFYERKENGVSIIVSTTKAIDGFRLFKEFKPEGTKNFTRFTITDMNLIEAEKQILDIIKDYLRKI